MCLSHTFSLKYVANHDYSRPKNEFKKIKLKLCVFCRCILKAVFLSIILVN